MYIRLILDRLSQNNLYREFVLCYVHLCDRIFEEEIKEVVNLADIEFRSMVLI